MRSRRSNSTPGRSVPQTRFLLQRLRRGRDGLKKARKRRGKPASFSDKAHARGTRHMRWVSGATRGVSFTAASRLPARHALQSRSRRRGYLLSLSRARPDGPTASGGVCPPAVRRVVVGSLGNIGSHHTVIDRSLGRRPFRSQDRATRLACRRKAGVSKVCRCRATAFPDSARSPSKRTGTATTAPFRIRSNCRRTCRRARGWSGFRRGPRRSRALEQTLPVAPNRTSVVTDNLRQDHAKPTQRIRDLPNEFSALTILSAPERTDPINLPSTLSYPRLRSLRRGTS